MKCFIAGDKIIKSYLCAKAHIFKLYHRVRREIKMSNERRVGTVSRGIRCPIFREGDDLA